MIRNIVRGGTDAASLPILAAAAILRIMLEFGTRPPAAFGLGWHVRLGLVDTHPGRSESVSSRRKILVVLLAAVASISVVLAAIWMAAGPGPSGPGNGLAGTGPKVTFATSSGSTEVDGFIRRFIDLCVKGDYDQYRRHWTTYVPPVSLSRFKAMWGAAKDVQITQIRAIPGGRNERPAYLIIASVQLDPQQVRDSQMDVPLQVRWEDDRWVVAPAPRSLIEPEPDLPITDLTPASQPEGAPAGHG